MTEQRAIPNQHLIHGKPKWTLAIFEVQLGVPCTEEEMEYLPGAEIVNGRPVYPEHDADGNVRTRRITFNYNPAAADLLNPKEQAVLSAAFRAARTKARNESNRREWETQTEDGDTDLPYDEWIRQPMNGCRTTFVDMGTRFISRRLIENKIPAS